MRVSFTHVAVGVTLAVSSIGAMAQSSAADTTRSGSKNYYMPYERNFWSYAGGAIGRSDYDIGCRAGFGCDSRATGLKAFTGGKFNAYSGLEASYVYLGNAERAGGDTWGQGINLSFVGTLAAQPVVRPERQGRRDLRMDEDRREWCAWFRNGSR